MRTLLTADQPGLCGRQIDPNCI